MQNFPSIPSHQFTYGYEWDANGKLSKIEGRDRKLSGVGRDSAGPGQYDVPDSKRVAGPIVEWKPPTEKTKAYEKAIKPVE